MKQKSRAGVDGLLNRAYDTYLDHQTNAYPNALARIVATLDRTDQSQRRGVRWIGRKRRVRKCDVGARQKDSSRG